MQRKVPYSVLVVFWLMLILCIVFASTIVPIVLTALAGTCIFAYARKKWRGWRGLE